MESPCKSKLPFTTFVVMKQVSPILKFLSWFWPIRLERRSSPFNRVLDVDLSHGHLQLNTRQANYSFGRLHTVMEKSLARIHRDNQTYNEVLMLGYGGGSAAQILRRYHPTCNITAVELDPEVVALAQKWFYSEDIHFIVDDAIDFVRQEKGRYDLIVCDIFRDIYMPDAVRSEAFYVHCKHLLGPKGCFIHNTMGIKEEALNQEVLFRRVFPKYETLTLFTNNTIFHGFSE